MLEYIFQPLFLIGATIFIAAVFPGYLGMWVGGMCFVFLGYLVNKFLGIK